MAPYKLGRTLVFCWFQNTEPWLRLRSQPLLQSRMTFQMAEPIWLRFIFAIVHCGLRKGFVSSHGAVWRLRLSSSWSLLIASSRCKSRSVGGSDYDTFDEMVNFYPLKVAEPFRDSGVVDTGLLPRDGRLFQVSNLAQRLRPRHAPREDATAVSSHGALFRAPTNDGRWTWAPRCCWKSRNPEVPTRSD